MKKIEEKQIRGFLNENALAIVSTVDSKGFPHAAPVYYVVDKALTLSFIAPVKTQKVINIMHQPEVVLTMTNDLQKETLQVRGRAHVDETLVSETIIKLSERFEGEESVVGTLPFLRYTKQKKTVIVVQPYDICMRRYLINTMEEGRITFASAR